ncbi:NPF8.1 [Symbiodinium microadriaticum]|nr:NPF8.1 [Symbiodinium microadriaticum]
MSYEEASSDAESSEGSDSVAENARSIRKFPIAMILLVELCERLTYYTLAGTQKVYMQNQLHKLPSSAAALNWVFSMLCYFWCIPGGLVADSIGRYKTIIGAGVIYATGTLCVAVAVVHAFQTSLGWMFTGGCLLLIAAGTGGIKPNIANFGADQIGDETESQRECQKTYFSLFYLAINIGVLFAFGFFTSITTAGLPGLVSQSEGYSFAYGAGAVFMIAAVLIFISFTPSYRRLPGSGLGPVKRLVRYQCRSLRGGGWRAVMSAIGWLCLPFFYLVTLAAVLAPPAKSGSEEIFLDPCSSAPTRRLHGGAASSSDTLNNTALALGSLACICLVVANLNTHWVKELSDEAKDDFGVEDARATFGALPMIVIVNIAFNLCYNSMNNAFPSQACQMDLRIGSMQLNGAFFNIADAFAILVFTPLFESCLYPVIARMKGSPVRLGQKIVAGLLVACSSNLVAAALEIRRRDAPYMCDAEFSQCAPGYTEDGLHGTRMKDISAFWIFMPFTLVGIAEILVNPCMYCYSYEAAPMQVRSLLQAINLFFQGSVSNAFTSVVTKLTYPNDLDSGHLENYYYVNAALAVGGILLYFAVARRCCHGKGVRAVIKKEEVVLECGADASDSDDSPM